jgi:3-dehydroquinate synthase
VKTIVQEFAVPYRYPVVFTRDAFGPENEALSQVLAGSGQQANRVLVVVDSQTVAAATGLLEKIEKYGQRHLPLLDYVDAPHIARGGEGCKGDTAAVERIHALIDRCRLCRHSFVLAIGGGALLDTAGYAAATAHRGIRLIRMPTTTLAQGDAGVGVKTGINGFGRKNYLGTFTPPYAVINDFAFLETLPEREKRAGMAEAVKVALIKDRAFFDDLYRQRGRLAAFDRSAMEAMVFRCAALHLEHIGAGGDPFEQGSSRPLDFGHWSAHKIEALTAGELGHGEAVAIGVALDTLYSRHAGSLTEIEAAKILVTLEELGFDLYHWSLGWLNVGEALREFQEHLGGELSITLLDGIGRMRQTHRVDPELMKACIGELQQRQENKEKRNGHSMPPEDRRGDAGSLLHREPRQAPGHRILS